MDDHDPDMIDDPDNPDNTERRRSSKKRHLEEK